MEQRHGNSDTQPPAQTRLHSVAALLWGNSPSPGRRRLAALMGDDNTSSQEQHSKRNGENGQKHGVAHRHRDERCHGRPMAVRGSGPWGSKPAQLVSQRTRTDGRHLTGDPTALSFWGRDAPPGQAFLTSPNCIQKSSYSQTLSRRRGDPRRHRAGRGAGSSACAAEEHLTPIPDLHTAF